MWSAAVLGVVQEPRVWGGAAHAVQSLQESGLTEVWGGAAHAARSSPVVKPATECHFMSPVHFCNDTLCKYRIND